MFRAPTAPASQEHGTTPPRTSTTPPRPGSYTPGGAATFLPRKVGPLQLPSLPLPDLPPPLWSSHLTGCWTSKAGAPVRQQYSEPTPFATLPPSVPRDPGHWDHRFGSDQVHLWSQPTQRLGVPPRSSYSGTPVAAPGPRTTTTPAPAVPLTSTATHGLPLSKQFGCVDGEPLPAGSGTHNGLTLVSLSTSLSLTANLMLTRLRLTT